MHVLVFCTYLNTKKEIHIYICISLNIYICVCIYIYICEMAGVRSPQTGLLFSFQVGHEKKAISERSYYC